MTMYMQRMYVTVLATFIIGFMGCDSGQKSNSHPGVLWEKGKLLASENFSNNLNEWMSEGAVVAEIENGKLRFESLAHDTLKVERGNIWWKKRFEGPILIEYEYRSATQHGLSMVWWFAHSRNDTALLEQQRTGDYKEYIVGNMNGYHISYHRNDSRKTNFRKSYGFHLLSSVVDPVPLKDTSRHTIQIYSQENRFRFLVDGELVHTFTDTGQPCMMGDQWVHEGPCKGTGKPFTNGYIGFRHINEQVAYYDNLKVYRLLKPEAAK